jgi:hypothetical protein
LRFTSRAPAETARVADGHDQALLPVRQRDEHECAAGEQGPRVGAVEVAALGIEEVAAGDVPESVAQGDEALEAAHRHGDHIGARRVLTQAAGEQVEGEIVAAQDHQEPALSLVRQDHEVHGVGARRGAVELLDVALGGPGLHQLDEPGLFEAQDVMAHPGRMMAHDVAQLRERRRATHQQSQKAQPLLVGKDADRVDGADVADLFQGGPSKDCSAALKR